VVPSERSIRDELRKEAAQVQVPTNMWHHINHRLDEDQKIEQNRRAWFQRFAQWKPNYAMAAAAAILLFRVMPVGGANAPAPGANPTPIASLLAPIKPDEWGTGAARARADYTLNGQVDQPGSAHLLKTVRHG
jgi:hypothetical protein